MAADSAHALMNRIPWRMKNPVAELHCEWLFTGNKQFTEPFFEDTIAASRRFAENNQPVKAITSLEEMVVQASFTDAVSASAIIFHVSRCGSTLVSQLLCCDERNIVLSEVPFIDELLRLPLRKEIQVEVDTDRYVEAAIRLYSQKHTAVQQYVFVKTDSWHIHFYEQYRKLFATIPFILLYRDPLEVILSQRKQRGIQSVPGILEREIFGFEKKEDDVLNLDSYMADVLVSYFKKMISIVQHDQHVLLYNYRDGIAGLVKEIYRITDHSLENELEEQFNQRSVFHAKFPQQVFSEKKAEELIPSYLEEAYALYTELDEIRTSSNSEY